MSSEARFSAVDLACESDFSLGSLSVRPSTTRVIASGREQRVEPRVMQVLIVLVRNLGATVTRDQLIDACWEGRIVSDDAVSRVISQVRALARLSDPPAFRLETLTKVGFRMLADSTASQPQPAETKVAPAPSPPIAERKFSFARNRFRVFATCALTGLIALACATWWLNRSGSGAAMTPPLVAVSAFDNPSADPLVSPLAHGLQAETVKMLGKIPTEVRLVALTGVTPPRETRLLLRGDVQREVAQARVDVQLVDPDDSSILWAETFYRPLDQSLRLQTDVALTVASMIRAAAPQVSAGAPRIPASALAGYLTAMRWFQASSDSRTVSEFIPPLEATIHLAPNFAAAWARLAEAYRMDSRYKEEAEQNEYIERSHAAALRALSLAPRMGYAKAVLSSLQPEWSWRARVDTLHQAETLSPSDTDVLFKKAILMRRLGRLEDERLTDLRIAQIDIFSPLARRRAWGDELDSGDLKKAKADLLQLQAEDPGAVVLWFGFMNFALRGRDREASAEGLRQMEAVWPQIVADRHLSAASAANFLADYRRRTEDLVKGRDQRASNTAHAVADFNRLASDMRGQGCATDIIQELAAFRPDLAWVVVEELYLRRGYVGVHATCGHPVYADRQAATWPLFTPEAGVLRRDVRIWRVFKAVGLASYWQESGLWPDFCRDPTLGYDCRAEARKVLARP